ncbi:hypothetical protein ACJBU6_09393 [Exserohilum turcicum]
MDTLTNIAIMAFPVWVIWDLQMPRGKKISIMCLFATGFICVMFACLRVIQVGVNTSKPINKGLPLDPTWLAIWGMVECSIAVVIGCCPALAVLLKIFHSKPSSRPTYNPHGYLRQSNSNSDSGSGLKTELGVVEHKEPRNEKWSCGLNKHDSRWTDANSSQQDLRTDHDAIVVLHTVSQDSVDNYETR